MSRSARLRAAAAFALSAMVFAPLHALEIGQRGTLHTVVRGFEPIEIPVTYLGVLENSAGPGYDIHLVELDGELASEVGVASGMSGSPVYFDGTLLGALAYRFGALPKRAIGGVTPLATMLDAERLPFGGSASVGTGDPALRPIATPVTAAGLLPSTRRWLAPRLEAFGLRLISGAASASTSDDATRPSVRTSDEAVRALVPGAPVGVQLVRGDLDIAASGTVTAVDGDRVLAFGHPFLGGGLTSFPMTTADVVHTLADMAGSFRMTRTGTEVGEVVEDRLTAIVGRTDRRATMIPFELSLSGRVAQRESFRFEVARHTALSPVLVATSLLNALSSNNGADRNSTVHLDGELTMDGAPALPLHLVATGADGADPNLGVTIELLSMLTAIWRNDFAEPSEVRLRLDGRVVPEVVAYVVEDIRFDRSGLRGGDELEVQVGLRRHRSAREVKTIRLTLPDGAERARGLVLAVGGPTEIERLLGTPLSRRLESATDLASTVEVYADLPPAGRLQAVLARPGGAIVSRGETWVDLPPSAARLLATERTMGESRRAAPPTVVAVTSIDLDGPVRGWVRETIRLDGPADIGTVGKLNRETTP